MRKTLEKLIAEDNLVVAHFTVLGTHFPGIPATHKAVAMQDIFHRLQNGKFVED